LYGFVQDAFHTESSLIALDIPNEELAHELFYILLADINGETISA